jgi:hypothetical protein
MFRAGHSEARSRLALRFLETWAKEFSTFVGAGGDLRRSRNGLDLNDLAEVTDCAMMSIVVDGQRIPFSFLNWSLVFRSPDPSLPSRPERPHAIHVVLYMSNI